jgi:hypothetical protein
VTAGSGVDASKRRLCPRLREARPAFHPFAGVAQRQEHSVVSRGGAGSNPVVRVRRGKNLRFSPGAQPMVAVM